MRTAKIISIIAAVNLHVAGANDFSMNPRKEIEKWTMEWVGSGGIEFGSGLRVYGQPSLSVYLGESIYLCPYWNFVFSTNDEDGTYSGEGLKFGLITKNTQSIYTYASVGIGIDSWKINELYLDGFGSPSRREVNLNGYSMPISIGLKLRANEHLNFNFEFLLRYQKIEEADAEYKFMLPIGISGFL